MKVSENMKFTIVQVGKQFICLTPAETVKPIISADNKTKSTEYQVSFGLPFIYPIEDNNLKGHLLESPKELAELVKEAMRAMAFETKDVYLCAEGPEVMAQEYKHSPAKEKFLNNIATLEAKTIITDQIENYTIIRCEYDSAYGKLQPQGENIANADECTASLFAMPVELIKQIKQAFEQQFLRIVKFIPPQTALIKAANTAITSFDKVVALFSMDYVSIRLVVMQNGKPLFCHSFPSPMGDIAEVVAKDKDIKFAEAMDFIRKTGFGLAEQCNFPQNETKITELLESSASDILRNMRMVLLSSRLELDQIFLSDCIGLMPGVIKYIRQLGFTADVNLISDSFLPSSNVPFVQALADDRGYKAACFYMYTYLFNSGAAYKNNLLFGTNETKQTNNKMASYATLGLGVVAVLVMAFFGWQSIALEIQKTSDEAQLVDTKYDEAKQLIASQNDLTKKQAGIEKDKSLLPTTAVTVNEIMDNLFTQLSSKVTKVNTYNVDHKMNTIALNFDIDSLEAYVDLKNEVENQEYFNIAKPFTATGNEDTKKYNCAVTFGVKKLDEAKAAAEKQKLEAAAAAEQQATTGGKAQ